MTFPISVCTLLRVCSRQNIATRTLLQDIKMTTRPSSLTRAQQLWALFFREASWSLLILGLLRGLTLVCFAMFKFSMQIHDVLSYESKTFCFLFVFSFTNSEEGYRNQPLFTRDHGGRRCRLLILGEKPGHGVPVTILTTIYACVMMLKLEMTGCLNWETSAE